MMTTLLTYWLSRRDEFDALIAQLSDSNFSVPPASVALLIVVVGTALFLASFFRFRWFAPHYFTGHAIFHWIFWGVLSGIPHGFLIHWKQQADSPHDAALSATSSFIVVPLIVIVTFWVAFRLYPLRHQNPTASMEESDTP